MDGESAPSRGGASGRLSLWKMLIDPGSLLGMRDFPKGERQDKPGKRTAGGEKGSSLADRRKFNELDKKGEGGRTSLSTSLRGRGLSSWGGRESPNRDITVNGEAHPIRGRKPPGLL